MKKKIAFIIILILVFTIGVLVGKYAFSKTIKEEKKVETISNVDIKYNNNNKYYIIKGDYNGEYDYQKVSFSEYYQNLDESKNLVNSFNTSKILTYNEYNRFCGVWNLKQKYNDKNKKYMIVSFMSKGNPIVESRLANVIENEGKTTLYIWENIKGSTADIIGYFLVVPVELSTYQNEIVITYTDKEYENIVNYGYKNNPNMMKVD